jgi:outer membrane protein
MKSVYWHRKGFICLFVVFLLSFSSVAFSGPSVKIGVVDLDKILNDSIKGADAKKLIEKEIKKTQSILRKEETEAKKILDELNKKGSVLSESVRKEKESEYRRKAREVQRFARDAEVEIKRRGDELSKAMVKDVSDIVEEVGKKEKFSIVIGSRSGLFYYAPSIDITLKVLKIYNDRYKKKK